MISCRNLSAKLVKLCHITKQFILNKLPLPVYSLPFVRKQWRRTYFSIRQNGFLW